MRHFGRVYEPIPYKQFRYNIVHPYFSHPSDAKELPGYCASLPPNALQAPRPRLQGPYILCCIVPLFSKFIVCIKSKQNLHFDPLCFFQVRKSYICFIHELLMYVSFKFVTYHWALFVDYLLQTTFCFPNFIKHARLKLKSCLTLCSCSYSLFLRVIKLHCLSSLLCSSSPSNLYNKPRILILNPKPSCRNPFFLCVDMATLTQTSSQLQVPPLVLKVYICNP